MVKYAFLRDNRFTQSYIQRLCVDVWTFVLGFIGRVVRQPNVWLHMKPAGKTQRSAQSDLIAFPPTKPSPRVVLKSLHLSHYVTGQIQGNITTYTVEKEQFWFCFKLITFGYGYSWCPQYFAVFDPQKERFLEILQTLF